MSDTDIYKERESIPVGNKSPRTKRQRRKESRRAFDDKDRKRRSKNSGLRRLLHLLRKSDNEKYFWCSMGVLFIGLLLIIAIWQFVVVENAIRSDEIKDEYMSYQPSIPESPVAEPVSE